MARNRDVTTYRRKSRSEGNGKYICVMGELEMELFVLRVTHIFSVKVYHVLLIVEFNILHSGSVLLSSLPRRLEIVPTIGVLDPTVRST